MNLITELKQRNERTRELIARCDEIIARNSRMLGKKPGLFETLGEILKP